MEREEKLKALDAALTQIERQYGKGAVMKLGDPSAQMNVETIPTGFCFWSSPRKGLCVWIDYKVVCDFLFMVNYRLFRPFLSASRTREAAAIFCSFCGIRSASASRYGQACFPAASGAACQASAGRIAPRHWRLYPRNPPPSPQR